MSSFGLIEVQTTSSNEVGLCKRPKPILWIEVEGQGLNRDSEVRL
jgi:hypothetical protein